MGGPNPLAIQSDTPDTPHNMEQIRRLSYRDGVAHAAMLGFGESFVGAFGIFLKATSTQIAALAALPPLVGAFSQIIGASVIERFRNRLVVVVRSALLQGALWIPISILPFLPGALSTKVMLLLGLVTIYHICAGLFLPAWSSLIGDLVPQTSRGVFFGGRNMWIGFATFVSVMVAGGLLEFSHLYLSEAVGFLSIFLLAAAARFCSAYWLARYDNPAFDFDPSHRFSIIDFIRRTPHSNYAKFVFFTATITFATFVAGPFFTVYMLRDLQFSYLQFTLITASSTVTQFMAVQHWGRLVDHFGCKRILTFCGYGVSSVPLLWLFSANFYYLLLIQGYAGFVWAGFNLAAGNFTYDAVTPPKRARAVAYQSVVNNCFLLFGSLLGSQIEASVPKLLSLLEAPIYFQSNLLVLFFVSGVLRFLTTLFWIPRFQEVREVRHVAGRELLFRIVNVRALSGATFSPITGVSNENNET